jgi:hypothetical protein
MSQSSPSHPDNRPVRAYLVTGTQFREAHFFPATGQEEPALMLSFLYSRKKNPVENLSFPAFDALKLIEAAAAALHRGGYPGTQRVAWALDPEGVKPNLPVDPVPVKTEETKGHKAAGQGQQTDSSTVRASRTAFLSAVAGTVANFPFSPLILLTLARGQGEIEQLALSHHDALMLADSLVRVLVKHGSPEAKRLAKSMREQGLR